MPTVFLISDIEFSISGNSIFLSLKHTRLFSMVSCSYIVINVILCIYLNAVIKGNYDTCCNVDESEDLMLGEINQSQKDKYCIIPLYYSEYIIPRFIIYHIQSSKIHKIRKYNGGCQRLEGRGNRELFFNGYRNSVLQEEKVLEIGCTTMWM